MAYLSVNGCASNIIGVIAAMVAADVSKLIAGNPAAHAQRQGPDRFSRYIPKRSHTLLLVCHELGPPLIQPPPWLTAVADDLFLPVHLFVIHSLACQSLEVCR
jgi:hypothetical protein